AGWDLKADVDSRGVVLWEEFVNGLYGSSVRPNSWWTVPYDPKNPLTTPRGINAADPDVPRVFADAVEFMNAQHVAPDVSLGSAQQYQAIPIPGRSDAFGCLHA